MTAERDTTDRYLASYHLSEHYSSEKVNSVEAFHNRFRKLSGVRRRFAGDGRFDVERGGSFDWANFGDVSVLLSAFAWEVLFGPCFTWAGLDVTVDSPTESEAVAAFCRPRAESSAS